jgi:hypothetical protein
MERCASRWPERREVPSPLRLAIIASLRGLRRLLKFTSMNPSCITVNGSGRNCYEKSEEPPHARRLGECDNSAFISIATHEKISRP